MGTCEGVARTAYALVLMDNHIMPDRDRRTYSRALAAAGLALKGFGSPCLLSNHLLLRAPQPWSSPR